MYSENDIATLTNKFYEIIDEYLEDVIDMKFGGPNSKIALIGGIMINCEGEGTDHFLPLKFDIRSPLTYNNLLEECFGKHNTLV